jgi:predicted enzyme related to lactoylglutathione lyase
MRRETIGESRMAVFAYEEGSVGGCLIASSNVPAPSAIGTIVYLDVSPSLNEALTRLQRAGGQVALARTELPDGMGCFAQVIDSEGNRVGLHAPA